MTLKFLVSAAGRPEAPSMEMRWSVVEAVFSGGYQEVCFSHMRPEMFQRPLSRGIKRAVARTLWWWGAGIRLELSRR